MDDILNDVPLITVPLLNRGFSLAEPNMFLCKAAIIVLFSLLLIPLILYEGAIGVVAYVVILVAIHVIVLFVFLFRVSCGGLDVDWTSFLLRLLTLGFFIGLLLIVA